MNKSYTTDVIIVGAGVAGLTLACLLEKQTNYRIILIERDNVSARPRVSAINALTRKIWQYLGVWGSGASPYYDMEVWDHCGSAIDFHAKYIKNEPLGYILHDQTVYEALLTKIKNSSQVRLLLGEHCTDLSQDDHQVHLNTQTSVIHASYLIACDGAHSWVRDSLSFSLTEWPYHHTAITTHVMTELPHHQTARQKFTSDGPLAFLPLLNPNHSSIVWSTPPEHAKMLLTLNDDEFAKELAFAFDGTLGKITHVQPRYAFPLRMRHAKEYRKNRVILSTDAAHTIHPLAGQGLNMAMQDSLALVEAFIAIEQGENATRVLRYYERSRKTENWQMIALLECIKRVYEIKTPEIQVLVNAGVSALNHCGPLKSFAETLVTGERFFPTRNSRIVF